MEILARLEIAGDDLHELANILSCEDADLAEVLIPYASAALEEFATMFLGQRVFSRGSDIREYRLYLLIKHVYKTILPHEQDVCRLFQCTSSGSRSLIRAVMSKYQYMLKDIINDTMKDCIDGVEIDDDMESVTFAVHNLNLVDELNRELSEIDSSLPPVRKRIGSVSTYELKPSSYKKLCERFDLESKISEDE